MESSDLHSHVDHLADLYGVEIDVRPFAQPVAHLATRRVTIKPIKSLVTYFAALHEIGHVVVDHGATADMALRVLSDHIEHGTELPTVVVPRVSREYSAWRWAIDEALHAPNHNVWLLILTSLQTHIDSELARRKRGELVVLPSENHPVFALLAEARLGCGMPHPA